MRRTYTVAYNMFPADEDRRVDVEADCKENAYNIACYVAIPLIEREHAYSVWVESATKKNGQKHFFNSFSGKRY